MHVLGFNIKAFRVGGEKDHPSHPYQASVRQGKTKCHAGWPCGVTKKRARTHMRKQTSEGKLKKKKKEIREKPELRELSYVSSDEHEKYIHKPLSFIIVSLIFTHTFAFFPCFTFHHSLSRLQIQSLLLLASLSSIQQRAQ